MLPPMITSKNLGWTAAILIPLNLLLFLILPDGSLSMRYVSDFMPILTSLIACYCLFLAFKSFKTFDHTKLSWMLILIGTILNMLAESTYAFLEIYAHIDMSESFPTLADVFWCNAYLPLVSGMWVLYWAYKKSGFPMGNTKLYWLFATLFSIVISCVILYLLIPVMQDDETTLLAKIFYLFYPVADLFLVIPAVILMYITSLFGTAILSKPLRFLTIGFIFMTVADLIYSVLDWQDLYSNGNYTDLLWNAGYLAIGIAALRQKELIESFKI